MPKSSHFAPNSYSPRNESWENSNLFVPSKTATLVPEFAVEDLPLGRNAALVPEFALVPAFGQNTDDDLNSSHK